MINSYVSLLFTVLWGCCGGAVGVGLVGVGWAVGPGEPSTMLF